MLGNKIKIKGRRKMKKYVLSKSWFRKAVKRAKQRRHEIWKEEMEYLDSNMYGYCK